MARHEALPCEVNEHPPAAERRVEAVPAPFMVWSAILRLLNMFPSSSSSSSSSSSFLRFPFRLLPFIFLLPLLFPFTDCRLLDTSVACDQHNFILSLNFDLPFRGLVYSEEGFPNCVYVNGTMLSHINYQLKIPLHGCETHVNADGNFENGIIIQENVAFLQSTDKKYLLTCIPSTPHATTTTATSTTTTTTTGQPIIGKKLTQPMELLGFGRENAVTVDFGGVTVDQSLLSSTERIGGTLSSALSVDSSAPSSSTVQPELKYAVEIRAGHALDAPPISTALNIGDQISYVVRLQKPVSESQIGRCWASDSKSSLELSDEHGCSLQPRGNIWGQFERVESEAQLVFVNRIKAWAFPTSNEVNIFCNLRVCMSRHCSFATNCTMPEAAAAAADAQQQQRRRRAGGEFAEVETLRTHIRIRAKRSQNGGNEPAALLTSSAAASGIDGIDPQNWCLSLAQLALLGFCCCAASVCLSAGAAFVLFAHFWRQNLAERAKDEENDELWRTTIAEMNRKQREKVGKIGGAGNTTAPSSTRSSTTAVTSRTRHAI